MGCGTKLPAGFLALAVTCLGVGCGGGGRDEPRAVAHTSDSPTATLVEPIRHLSVPVDHASASAPVIGPWTIEPGSIQLLAGDPGVQFRLVRSLGAERVEDRTAQAAWSVQTPDVLDLGASGQVRPIGPGQTVIRAQIGDEQAIARVAVSADPPEGRAWDFGADIVPLLTRQGCNTGTCHGRATGQNGFHLSLLGYDPVGDYQALLTAQPGRQPRVDRAEPLDSLLLMKASGLTPHGGGVRLPVLSPEHDLIWDWIAAGAPESAGETHGALESVAIEPPKVLLAEPGPVQLRVVARYADGHVRDVTRLAWFRSNSDSAAEVNADGLAHLLHRGEADIVVRYQSHVLAVRLACPVNPDLNFDFAALPRSNLIDQHLWKRLQELQVPPSPAADDATFLRRASLDLTGQLPQPADVRAYLADTAPGKVETLVDELMSRRDFNKFWAIKLGDLLQISSTRFPLSAGAYQMWLDEKLQANAPWDAMVRELLTATGNPAQRGNGAASYALDGEDAKTRAERTAQRFLGLGLRCAQCHDHPFDVWTQDDYYGLAAFFAPVQYEAVSPCAPMAADPTVRLDPSVQVIHERTGQPVAPRFLDGGEPDLQGVADPRVALADWMTRPANPYLARAMANWVWAQFFGRGLVEPADDLSAANPAVHPELLDALADFFVQSGYDLRALIRLVATSHAYALSAATVPGNAADDRLFSHHVPRPLTAHQMADALAQATDVPNLYPNRARGTRAIEVFDPAASSAILDTFGRCDRATACAVVPAPPLSLSQSLLLIGGDTIEAKVVHINGYLAELLEYTTSPEDLVESLYLRTLCRPPSDEERSYWSRALAEAPRLAEAAEDLFWALLQSREFAFNH